MRSFRVKCFALICLSPARERGTPGASSSIYFRSYVLDFYFGYLRPLAPGLLGEKR
jgi:hypothetical protein